MKALVYYDFQTCCLDLHNDKGDTPLHLASRWGYEAIVRVLLENGAGVRALNNGAHTPAHCALNSKVNVRTGFVQCHPTTNSFT